MLFLLQAVESKISLFSLLQKGGWKLIIQKELGVLLTEW